MSSEFPRVEGGGSLILAWQVRGKHVLVVGGGEVINILVIDDRKRTASSL